MPAAATLRQKNKSYQKSAKQLMEEKKKQIEEESSGKPQVGPFVLAILLFVVVGSGT